MELISQKVYHLRFIEIPVSAGILKVANYLG
jgi:hypothetical protein